MKKSIFKYSFRGGSQSESESVCVYVCAWRKESVSEFRASSPFLTEYSIWNFEVYFVTKHMQ